MEDTTQFGVLLEISRQIGSIQAGLAGLDSKLDAHIKVDEAVAKRVDDLEANKNKILGGASVVTFIGTLVGSAIGFFGGMFFRK